MGVDIPVDRSFQNYQNHVRNYASLQLLELTTIGFRATKIMSTSCDELATLDFEDIMLSFKYQS